MNNIKFSCPSLSDLEHKYFIDCLKSGNLSGDSAFTKRCHTFLERHYGSTVLLTNSCTASLEMSAILLNIKPGDEVILPSFTFVSTANAFVLRGAVPVFVDIREDTFNINEDEIEKAITPLTKAIVPVHYAGVGANMDSIARIAKSNGLPIVEDAAQGYLSDWNGRPLGTIGDIGCISFHNTKNIGCGEGGAIIINNDELVARSHVIREKGTNRTSFIRGDVAKYEWLDIGSSFLPSDITAAVLLAQLEHANEITTRRLRIWNRYNEAFQILEMDELIKRPCIPPQAQHNAHAYSILLHSSDARNILMHKLREIGIPASTHYVALHSSPAGKKHGRPIGQLPITKSAECRLLRIPIHAELTEFEVEYIISSVVRFAREI